MNENRINARLDEHSAAELEYIRQATGSSTITDALKYSITQVATRLRQSNSDGAKMKAFLNSGFVGCAEAPEDISENYKELLASDWSRKHGNR